MAVLGCLKISSACLSRFLISAPGAMNAKYVCSFRPLKGRTNIGSALKKAWNVFTKYKGFAKRKEIYLFSDGKVNSGKYPRQTLRRLNKLGVEIFVFATGKRPRLVDLSELASKPKRTHLYRLKGNGRLERNIIRRLTGRKG